MSDDEKHRSRDGAERDDSDAGLGAAVAIGEPDWVGVDRGDERVAGRVAGDGGAEDRAQAAAWPR